MMTTSPERGEIWQVTFEPTIGAEIAKTRPALVLNIAEAGRLPLRIVAPITFPRPFRAQILIIPDLGLKPRALSPCRSAA